MKIKNSQENLCIKEYRGENVYLNEFLVALGSLTISGCKIVWYTSVYIAKIVCSFVEMNSGSEDSGKAIENVDLEPSPLEVTKSLLNMYIPNDFKDDSDSSDNNEDDYEIIGTEYASDTDGA